MKNLGFLSDIRFKINLIIVLTAFASAIGVYAVTYFLMHSALLDDMKRRAVSANEYTQRLITPSCFTRLNSREDEASMLYAKTRRALEGMSAHSNIEYLYTAKKDGDGRLIYVIDGLHPGNPNFRHIGAPIEDYLSGILSACLDGDTENSEGFFNTKHGYFYVTYSPVRDERGGIAGAVGMEFNVTHLYAASQNAKMFSFIFSMLLTIIFILISRVVMKRVSEPFYKKLAYQDYLSGLPNRMAFEEHLAEYEQNAEIKDNVSLIIFDLNNLKTINDTLGHGFGDIYLKNSASIISNAFKNLGETYRIGGDEFSTLTIGHSEEEIQETIERLFGEKISDAVKDYPFDCACGTASFDPAVDKTLRDVLARADKKMYERKRTEKMEDKIL